MHWWMEWGKGTPMNSKVIKALYRKEMLDILRDKKTILMMIVIPLILYPLIFLGSMLLTSSMLNASTTNIYRIGFDEVVNQEELTFFFDEAAKEYDYEFRYIHPDAQKESMQEALENGDLDAYVTTTKEEGKMKYQICYLSSENSSQTAAGMLRDMFIEYNKKLSEDIITDNHLVAEDVLNPILYEYEDLSSSEETVGSRFGYIIPFLLITSILMGSMYPAIDTTAGEKERGTMETLLTLPVKNMELIMSKFLATSTIAVAAALLNLISMGVLGVYFYQSMQSVSETAMTFDLMSYLPAMGITVLCVVVFAMFASAVCLCVCIFAKSFKEAQNYTTPVMLVFMIAGMAGMIPALELNKTTALIPVVNIAMLIAELFKFHFDISLIAMVLFSNIAYSMLAIVFMTRLFKSEDVLFGDGSNSIHLLERRSNMKKNQIPGIGDNVLLFSILLIILLFAGSIAIIKWKLYGLILEQALILVATVFYAWYIRADRKRVFSLQAPKIRDVFCTVILWMGAYLLMILASAGLTVLFPESAKNANATVELWENVPLWLIVLSSAAMPAFCEEMAFRGFLFGTLKNRIKMPVAILITGMVFGLYHMNFVKFFVVGALGCLLAYAVYKGGSIWLSILIHFLNNLFSVVITLYPEPMKKIVPFLMEEDLTVNSIVILLIVGIVLTTLGIVLFKWSHGDYKKKIMG